MYMRALMNIADHNCQETTYIMNVYVVPSIGKE